MFRTQVAACGDWLAAATCGAEKVWVTVTMTFAAGTPAARVIARRIRAIASALIEVRSRMTSARSVRPPRSSSTRTKRSSCTVVKLSSGSSAAGTAMAQRPAPTWRVPAFEAAARAGEAMVVAAPAPSRVRRRIPTSFSVRKTEPPEPLRD